MLKKGWEASLGIGQGFGDGEEPQLGDPVRSVGAAQLILLWANFLFEKTIILYWVKEVKLQ